MADLGVMKAHVFLTGRPPVEEYMAFLIQAAAGQPVDLPAAVLEWRVAASVVDALCVAEAGVADGQVIGPVPESIQGAASQFLEDPVVASTFAVLTPTIGLVELDKLVVYQKQINLAYAAELRGLVKGWRQDSQELLDFCLSRDQPRPPITRLQANQTLSFSDRHQRTQGSWEPR
jgi:hypothetical protein